MIYNSLYKLTQDCFIWSGVTRTIVIDGYVIEVNNTVVFNYSNKPMLRHAILDIVKSLKKKELNYLGERVTHLQILTKQLCKDKIKSFD